MNVIFDVDGTLVQSYALDTDCFVRAVREVLGDVRIHDDWRAYTHVTDAGILAQICTENGVEPCREAAVRDRFAARIAAALAADPRACPEVPGAGAMLGAVAGQGARVGLATGGWAVTAVAKLRRAGIGFDPDALYSSDIAVARTAIMRACLTGVGQADVPTVYVGDGEWDMAATAALGWRFIGIGPRLRGRADRWVADFETPDFARHLAELSGGALRL